MSCLSLVFQYLFVIQYRISTKKDEVVRSHDMTEKLLKERKDVLKQSKEFHQFHADIEEVCTTLFVLQISEILWLISLL